MTLPLHLGVEHPDLVWLVVVAFLSFIAGLGVNLYRTFEDESSHESSPNDGRVRPV